MMVIMFIMIMMVMIMMMMRLFEGCLPLLKITNYSRGEATVFPGLTFLFVSIKFSLSLLTLLSLFSSFIFLLELRTIVILL